MEENSIDVQGDIGETFDTRVSLSAYAVIRFSARILTPALLLESRFLVMASIATCTSSTRETGEPRPSCLGLPIHVHMRSFNGRTRLLV